LSEAELKPSHRRYIANFRAILTVKPAYGTIEKKMPPTALETTSKNDQSPGNVEHVTKAKNGVAAVPTSAEAMRMEHHYGAHK
jgi:hypothetical protein